MSEPTDNSLDWLTKHPAWHNFIEALGKLCGEEARRHLADREAFMAMPGSSKPRKLTVREQFGLKPKRVVD